MRNFIEVTDADNGKNCLLNVYGIIQVCPLSKGTYISLNSDESLYVEESYGEVKKLILKAQKSDNLVSEKLPDEITGKGK